jgi:hypothetical protein
LHARLTQHPRPYGQNQSRVFRNGNELRWGSRASWPLLITTLTIMVFGAWLPYSPLASSLGLTHLPALYWPILLLTLLAYTCLTQGVKVWLLRMKWI